MGCGGSDLNNVYYSLWEVVVVVSGGKVYAYQCPRDKGV